jgi:hypothetical protein
MLYVTTQLKTVLLIIVLLCLVAPALLPPYSGVRRALHKLENRGSYGQMATGAQAQPVLLRRNLHYVGRAAEVTAQPARVVYYLRCADAGDRVILVESLACQFCALSCDTFEVLQEHLTAAHDRFNYAFSRDGGGDKTSSCVVLVEEAAATPSRSSPHESVSFQPGVFFDSSRRRSVLFYWEKAAHGRHSGVTIPHAAAFHQRPRTRAQVRPL